MAALDHPGIGQLSHDDKVKPGSFSTETNTTNDDKTSAFLERCGLRSSAISLAHEFAKARIPGWDVTAAPFQGYCSYTLVLTPDGRRDSGCEVRGGDDGTGSGRLVQFRPRRHAIDVETCAEARRILGPEVVPEAESLGVLGGLETVGGDEGELCGYVVERVRGISLTDFRGSSGGSDGPERERIVRDLAAVFASSWRGRRDETVVVRGRVGASLGWRLRIMLEGLPLEFRGVVGRVIREMEGIEGLGWAIAHGDLVPDNIMVQPVGSRAAGGLVGLIDWAEAEWLPFGVGMYGLEEVLGRDVFVEDGFGPGGGGSRFEYYPDAGKLRAVFWEEIGRVVGDEEVVGRVKWAQVLGALLWRGIAFDDGALERVVDPERDGWDVQRLRVWLFDEGGLGMVASSGGWWKRVWRGLSGWVWWCFR